MAQKKYTDGSGVSEIWTNTKNYIAAQLLGKSDVGHTHTMSDITDLEVWNYDSNSNSIIVSGGTDTWSYDSQSDSIIVS